MNIIELAKKYSPRMITWKGGVELRNETDIKFNNAELQAFAQAVIEEYKASLVPVATTYISSSGYMEAEFKGMIEGGIPLYALPSGETK